MLINKYLSIVIPTYNRANFLDYSLEVHIPMLEKYNVQIFISDNASTDNTEEVVKKWIKKYPLLHYSKNETNIGADGNFEKALKISDTDYIWLLSDTYKIPLGLIEYILKDIENYDMFVVNLANKIVKETQVYNSGNELLYDIGAVMTCAAINIYSKKLINNADFQRYSKTNFIQTGIIFEYLSNKDFKVKWIQEYSIISLTNLELKKSNWSHTSKVFEIGCEDWINFVMSLPPFYKLENKMKCIMDFGKVSGIFSFQNLILLRARKVLTVKSYLKFYSFFGFTIKYPKFIVFLIAIIPRFFLVNILKILVKIFFKSKKHIFKSMT